MKFRRYDEVLKSRVAEHREMTRRRENGERVFPYLPTGIPTWDANGGLPIEVATLIAGETGEGKSAVKLALVKGIASSGVGDVYTFELEDPLSKTADRTFSQSTGVGSKEIGRCEYEPRFLDQLDAALKVDEGWARHVHVHEGLIDAEVVKATLHSLPSNTAAVFLDYAQGLGTVDLERIIADIAWEFNVWAQKRKAAAVIFSQLKPEVQSRGKAIWDREKSTAGYRPMGKGDVKWSSALVERCKQVIFIHRPGRWKRKHGQAVPDDVMEIIFDKNNFADEGAIKLRWDGPRTAISEMP